jgi:hypothetical protein
MESLLEERKRLKLEFNKQLKEFNKRLNLQVKNEKYKNDVEFREATKKRNKYYYHNVLKKNKEMLDEPIEKEI